MGRLLVVVAFWSSALWAAGEGVQTFTLDGMLYTSPAQTIPLLDPTASLRLQILDSTKTCIVYEELQIVNTTTTGGKFTVQVGSPTSALKRGTNDAGNTMASTYQNVVGIPGRLVSNSATCTYTPTSGDPRYLRIVVTPTGGSSTILSPDMTMDAVPMATVAESLQGLSKTDVLALDSSTHLTQTGVAAIFNNTNYPLLTSLLAGTSAQYMPAASTKGAELPGYTTASPPASPAAGSIWYDTNTNTVKYYNGSSAVALGAGGSGISSLTVSSNMTAGGTTGGTLTGPGTIDLVDSVTAGTYFKVGVNAKGIVTSGSTSLAEADIPTLSTSGKVAGSAITGTIGGSVILNTSGDITTTGTTTTGTLSATNVKGRNVQIFDSGTHEVTLQTPSTLAGNYSLTLPAALPGSSGMVLSSDTSGVTSWTSLGGSSFGSQTANTFLAAPNGSSGSPSFRTIVAADLPSIGSGLSGTLPVANGGTGVTTGAANLIFATPNGSSGAPAFRALASADLPSISSGLTGTLPVANGGTGTTTGSIAGTSALTFAAGGTNSSVTLTPTGTGATVLGGNVGIGTSSPLAKLQVGVAPTATANFGAISLGNGAFDGTTSGFFAGSANGTDQAINNVTGYSGNFVDYQINGVSKFKVDASGKIYGDGSQLTGIGGSGTVNTGTANTLAYYGSAGSTVSTFANGSQYNILVGGASGVPTWGSINLASSTAVGTSILPVANGGTGTNSGSITGTGALTFAAGGTNSSVTLTPTGTGATVLGGNIGIGTSSPLAKLQVGVAPTATANFGVVSLGSGAFDGTTTGFFTGSASGTVQSINTASGYAGNLVDYQVAGVSKFKVDATGKVYGDGSGLSNVGAASFGSQTANTILAAPNGSTGTPSFRTLVAADLPSISSGMSGTLPVANGGTGTTTGSINGAGALTFAAGGTNSNVTISPTGTGSVSLGGSVGVGMTGPGYPLQVNGNIVAGVGGSKAGAVGLQPVDGSSWFWLDNNIGTFRITTGSLPGATKTQMVVLDTGNVGIGTTAPNSLLHVNGAPVATANYGVVSLGNGAFDGTTSGFFAGSANGTDQAINNVTGYSGNFVDYQINGISKFKVDAAGKIYGDGSQLTGLGGSGTVNTGTANTLAYYSSAGSTVSTLANGSQYNILVGGASGVPTWGSINLASSTAVGTSILPVANGGTGTNSGSITGTGALTFSAGGTNSSVTLAPAGTGSTNLGSLVGIGTSTPASALNVAVAPVATANYGVVSLANGAFDGTTVGKFAGSANGTVEAINTASGYTGNLVDYQVAGVSKFKVDATGKIYGDGSQLTGITATSYSGTLGVANGGTGTTTGSITGTTALTFAAGGTNQNVILTPSGTGYTVLNGYVGIGTTAPATYLDIEGSTNTMLQVGSSNTTSTSIQLNNSSAGAHNYQFYTTGSANGVGPGYFGVYDATASKTPFSINGATGAIATFSGGVYGFSNSANVASNPQDTGISRLAANKLAVGNGTQGDFSGTMVAGNVGIGSSSPVAKLQVAVAPTATANFGLVSLGDGAFDGTTTGKFVGSANGTDLAINNASGYSGNFVDYQVNGSSKFKVDATGKVTGDGSGLTNVAASSFAAQTANTVLAAPNGSSGTPTFRTLVAADLPSISTGLTGTLPIANGGTGTTTGSITGTSALTFAAGGTNQNVTLTPSGSGYSVLGGYVGIGTSTPAQQLEVAGNINAGSQTSRTTTTNRGQVAEASTYTQTQASAVTVNWNSGNIQEVSTFLCNGTNTVTMSNLRDGAAYTLLLSGTAAHSGTCIFSSSGFTFVTSGGAVAPTASKNVIFTFIVINTTVVYAMSDNLQ